MNSTSSCRLSVPFLQKLLASYLRVTAFVAFTFSAGYLLAQEESVAEKPTREPRAKKEKVVLEAVADASPTVWANRKMQMRFGMEFYSEENYCSKLYATVPFPKDWPEQKVTILESELPDQATYDFRELNNGAIQALIKIAQLPPNQQLDVILSVEIEKSFIKAPKDPSLLVLPKKTIKEKDIAWYLGDSPYIETKSRQVREIANEIKETQPANAWAHVEAIFDWVRNNIEYRKGPIRSTKDALRDKQGDCEEMTGLFVALCRATNIPARCVWIPEHCYPEFYLEDENGFGHWYPAQVAGDRQFGQMNDYRPILQKGDRFRVPEQTALQRYVAETFTCKQKPVGPTPPRIESIRDLGELLPELEKLKASTEPKIAAAAAPANTEDEMKVKKKVGEPPATSSDNEEKVDEEKDVEGKEEESTPTQPSESATASESN